MSVSKDPDLIPIFLRLKRNNGRPTVIPNRGISNKITWMFKPIRKDMVINPDTRYNLDQYLALKPDVEFDMIPVNNEKTVWDLIFKKLF